MSVFLYSDRSLTERRTKAASTAFAINSFVADNGSGALIPATAGTTNIAGVAAQVVKATDPDYATVGAPIMIIPANDDRAFKVTVTGGQLVQGQYYDLSDAVTVNGAAQAVKVVLCVESLSATEAIVKINRREQDAHSNI